MKTLIVFDLSIDNPEMRFLAKDTKSRDIIAIHSYRRMEHSAIMLDQSFAVRHEAHEGHEERGPDYKGSRISTRIPLPSRSSYHYSSQFARPAQMIRKLKELGVGNFSRQGAESRSLEENNEKSYE